MNPFCEAGSPCPDSGAAKPVAGRIITHVVPVVGLDHLPPRLQLKYA
jgi:hypothetical protein